MSQPFHSRTLTLSVEFFIRCILPLYLRIRLAFGILDFVSSFILSNASLQFTFHSLAISFTASPPSPVPKSFQNTFPARSVMQKEGRVSSSRSGEHTEQGKLSIPIYRLIISLSDNGTSSRRTDIQLFFVCVIIGY